jgi:nucleoside-diphosphate-sugar epimerase
MDSALIVGGTRFMGRFAVEDLRENGYEVTTFTRGNWEDPFADAEGVSHVRGDRTDRDALAAARDEVDPDVVFDFVGYFPEEIRTATELFADVDAYVFVSSGSAYAEEHVPMREDETPLYDCTPEQAADESMETYGNRKAECDRVVFEAAADGVNAMAVRPMLVYGPYDYTERTNYWLNRVDNYDRIVVPGDGDSLLHRAYAEDVARAMRVVAEEGRPGEAYNAADRRAMSLEQTVDLAADVMDTEVDVVHASARDLAEFDLEPTDFPNYVPRPALAATEKLAALGWESTPVEEAMARTVAEHREAGRTGPEDAPDRETEERILDALEE